MGERSEYGLVIDSEYSKLGMSGMQVIEIVQKLPKGKAYLSYLPFPTELCVLCGPERVLNQPAYNTAWQV